MDASQQNSMRNKPSTPLKIVAVEDREEDYQQLLRQLARGNYHVDGIRVESEKDFRAALANDGIDIVFADFLLPAFNAHSALQAYKESGRDVPFIVISGVIGEETAVEMVNAGANDYLLKDNLLRLNLIVERELRESKTRRELRNLREKGFRESVPETLSAASVRLHLEAIHRLLDRSEELKYRERINTLLE